MNEVIAFAIGMIAGVIVAGLLRVQRQRASGTELIRAQSEKKDENKRRVVEFMRGTDRITNNDIESLLGVSNATAERYLDELEKEGLLKQIGSIGQGVYYEPTNNSTR